MISVAIVGAGPSGLFAAQAIRRASPSAAISVLEQLPVPFGLVRYGVATDHQSTKAVTAQFERLFEREGVRFFGHVDVGGDLALDEVRDLFDAVVVATGSASDRELDVPGAHLPHVLRAGALTRWLNSYPTAEALEPELGTEIAIIGNGNVALDLARLLCRTSGEFAGTDIDPDRLRAVVPSGRRTIEIIGRRPAEAARFDAGLLAEFRKLSAARIDVLDLDEASTDSAVVAALRAAHGCGPSDAAVTVRFRFGSTPLSIDAGGVTVADAQGAVMFIPATSVVTAIGFGWSEPGTAGPGPFRIGPGLYEAGWRRRGGRGTIADARGEGRDLAAVLVDDLAARPDDGPRSGADGLAAALDARGVPWVDHAHWRRIDLLERRRATAGFIRRKLTRIDAMLGCAMGEGPSQQDPAS